MTPDICTNRHQGNAQSQAAFQQLESALPEWRKRVLEFVRSCGQHGATSKEIAKHFGKTINELSGRRSELLRDGFLRETGESRDGCGVVVAVEVEA